MGREVRKVRADWNHPKDRNTGQYRPMYEGAQYRKRKDEWLADLAVKGLQGTLDWSGNPPNQENYMPDWPEAERTHLMMYEDTSEGTPISPAFETPEELARWLADNGASSFGRSTATYEQWLPICRGGWAPSMVMDSHGIRSGIEALADLPKQSDGKDSSNSGAEHFIPDGIQEKQT